MVRFGSVDHMKDMLNFHIPNAGDSMEFLISSKSFLRFDSTVRIILVVHKNQKLEVINELIRKYLTCATFAIGADCFHICFFFNFLIYRFILAKINAYRIKCTPIKKTGDRLKRKIRENCTTFQKGPESLSNIALGVQNENVEKKSVPLLKAMTKRARTIQLANAFIGASHNIER